MRSYYETADMPGFYDFENEKSRINAMDGTNKLRS